MGQVLHGSAKTTHAIRAAIQRSQASVKELSERYDLNPKTVAGFQDMDNTAEDAPVIDTRHSPGVGRQKGLNAGPLLIGKPKQISHFAISLPGRQ